MLWTLPYSSSKVSSKHSTSSSSRSFSPCTTISSSASLSCFLSTRSSSKSLSSSNLESPSSRSCSHSIGDDVTRGSKSSLYDSGLGSQVSSDCHFPQKLSNERLSKEKAKFFRRRVKVESKGNVAAGSGVSPAKVVPARAAPAKAAPATTLQQSNTSKKGSDSASKKRLFSELDSNSEHLELQTSAKQKLPAHQSTSRHRTDKQVPKHLKLKMPHLECHHSERQRGCSTYTSDEQDSSNDGKSDTFRSGTSLKKSKSGRDPRIFSNLKESSKKKLPTEKLKHESSSGLIEQTFAFPTKKSDVEGCDRELSAVGDNETGSPTLSIGGSCCNGNSSGSGSPLEEGCSSSTTSSGAMVTSGHLRSLFDGLSHLYMTNDPRGCKRPSQQHAAVRSSQDATRSRPSRSKSAESSKEDLGGIQNPADLEDQQMLHSSAGATDAASAKKKTVTGSLADKQVVAEESSEQPTVGGRPDLHHLLPRSPPSPLHDELSTSHKSWRGRHTPECSKGGDPCRVSDWSSDGDISSDDAEDERHRHHHHHHQRHHCHHRHRHHHCRHSTKDISTDTDLRPHEEERNKSCDHHYHHHHKHHKHHYHKLHYHRHHHHYHRNHSGCKGKHTPLLPFLPF